MTWMFPAEPLKDATIEDEEEINERVKQYIVRAHTILRNANLAYGTEDIIALAKIIQKEEFSDNLIH